MQTFTVSQLTEILKMHERPIRKLLASGKLPARRIGRQWIVSEASLRFFLGENQIHNSCKGNACLKQA